MHQTTTLLTECQFSQIWLQVTSCREWRSFQWKETLALLSFASKKRISQDLSGEQIREQTATEGNGPITGRENRSSEVGYVLLSINSYKKEKNSSSIKCIGLTTLELLNSLFIFCEIWSIVSIRSLISFILSFRECAAAARALDRELVVKANEWILL